MAPPPSGQLAFDLPEPPDDVRRRPRRKLAGADVADEALRVRALVAAGQGLDAIARQLGLSYGQTARRLRLSALAAPLLQALRNGTLSLEIASRCADRSAAEQARLAQLLAERGTLTRADLPAPPPPVGATAYLPLPTPRESTDEPLPEPAPDTRDPHELTYEPVDDALPPGWDD